MVFETTYSKKVKQRILVQNVLIVVCLLSIAVFFYLKLRPSFVTYAVRDECGPLGGTISHSIGSEDECANACKAACQSYEQKYKNMEFSSSPGTCNNCTCICKE
ncbi:hypothetical protein JW930_07095 [Candidatus Woesearchaeota archaeon]|nr:hypothetical protein [Candidatus Woesearchaeota archaeon]